MWFDIEPPSMDILGVNPLYKKYFTIYCIYLSYLAIHKMEVNVSKNGIL